MGGGGVNFEHCVHVSFGLVGCRTCGMSDLWDVGLVGCRTCGMSDLWHVGLVVGNHAGYASPERHTSYQDSNLRDSPYYTDYDNYSDDTSDSLGYEHFLRAFTDHLGRIKKQRRRRKQYDVGIRVRNPYRTPRKSYSGLTSDTPVVLYSDYMLPRVADDKNQLSSLKRVISKKVQKGTGGIPTSPNGHKQNNSWHFHIFAIPK